MLPYYMEPALIYCFISTFSTFNTQYFIIDTIALFGWLDGWLIWRERKTLLVDWMTGWLADLA